MGLLEKLISSIPVPKAVFFMVNAHAPGDFSMYFKGVPKAPKEG